METLMEPSIRPAFGEPYYSPEYLSLKDSLGKEIDTTKQIATAVIIGQTSEKFRFDKRRSRVLFDLTELDGEADFALDDEERGKSSFTFSEKTLIEKDSGSFSATFDIIPTIKKAQSCALQGVANLMSCSSLFPAMQVVYEGAGGKAYSFELNAKIDKGYIYQFAPEPYAYAFFSNAEIAKRISRDTVEGITGFIQDINLTTLLPNDELYSYRNGNKAGTSDRSFKPQFAVYDKKAERPIPVSLKNMPMLRWGALRLSSKTFREDKALVSRNFNWELGFLGSKDILGAAAWNDLTGIQELVNRLEDTEVLMAQQAILDPGFFQ